jgi:hypothetical protein
MVSSLAPVNRRFVAGWNRVSPKRAAPVVSMRLRNWRVCIATACTRHASLRASEFCVIGLDYVGEVMKASRYLISAPLILAGVLLALYGIFLLVYQGDAGGGPTYIKIAGGEMDAHLAGGISIAIGAVLIGCGVAAARRRRIRH